MLRPSGVDHPASEARDHIDELEHRAVALQGRDVDVFDGRDAFEADGAANHAVCVSYVEHVQNEARALEVRVPFADHDVVSFCMGLPDDRRINRGRRKEILRRVSRGLLDDATIDKRKRGFFRAASSSWLDTHRDGIVREVLLDGRGRGRGIFDTSAVESLVAAPAAGGRSGEPLLAVLLLELWHRHFIDADGAGRRLTRDAQQAACA